MTKPKEVSLPDQPIVDITWRGKYRFKGSATIRADESIAETNSRVCTAVYAKDGSLQDLAEAIDLMNRRIILPGGRINAGAGTDRKVTLVNCFVMGKIPDSMDGIFANLKEAALTMQQGGGIGYDFSTLRPKGTPVRSVGADASGPLSFMDVWDAMCRTVMSAGERRGAMMATMRCDHPDIEDFITAKETPGRLRMFNLSVLVTDAFMDAVRKDENWDLVHNTKPANVMWDRPADAMLKAWYGSDTVHVHKIVNARILWEKILHHTYSFAEPGVIFIDRVNKMNNLGYLEVIAASNPCGEQMLPPYGDCCLGHINLAALVRYPFTEYAYFDMVTFQKAIRQMVRFLDNVLDVTGFPLEAQTKEALDKRRIGLGVTGLANMLMMLKIPYGSEGGRQYVEHLMETLKNEAYRASMGLAIDRGVFPLYNEEKYCASPFIKGLDEGLRVAISKYGIRNGVLLSLAPVGTGSLFAGNVSSGIEPVFGFSYFRKMLNADGTKTEYEVEDYAWRIYKETFKLADGKTKVLPIGLPDYMQTINDLTVEDHVRMQAVCQKHIDSSISKTINCPEDMPFEEFKHVYDLAYDLGLKGCTTYRPNPVTGSILSANSTENVEAAQAPAAKPQSPPSRPDELDGKTYKFKWAGVDGNEQAYYVTINNENGKPFEIFIATKAANGWINVSTRLMSAIMRNMPAIEFMIEDLKETVDVAGGAWVNKKYYASMAAYIGEIIERHVNGLKKGQKVHPEYTKKAEVKPKTKMEKCPKCHEHAVIREDGCRKCTSCTYSACG